MTSPDEYQPPPAMRAPEGPVAAGPIIVPVPPPPEPPSQDHAAIDAKEARARRVTTVVAAVAAVIGLALLVAITIRIRG
jgi:hypothetical protein